MNKTIYMLVMDKGGIKYKYFQSESQALKTAHKDAYLIAHGGTIWKLAPGEQWEFIADVPGRHNVSSRNLYTLAGEPK